MGSCFSDKAVQEPVVNLKKVRLLGLDKTKISLEGNLEIFNPQDLSSRFLGYNFQLDVEGQRLLVGTSNQPFSVPAKGTFSIAIPATILYADLLTLSKKELLGRDLKYRLFGTVIMDSWMAKLPLPFSYEGSFNLSEWIKEQARGFWEGV